MDKHKDNDVCMVRQSLLQYSHEVVEMSKYDMELFHKIYREISEELGIEAALTIHQMFKGTQVCFPIRFLDTQCVRGMILKEYDGKNVKMLAKKYDYSEKTIRRILQQSLEKKEKSI